MAGKRKYSGYIEKRGESYRISLCIRGRRYRKTVCVSTRAAAVLAAQQWESELRHSAQSGLNPVRNVIPMSKLLDVYETSTLNQLARGTQRAYLDCLKPIRTYFVQELDDPQLSEIGTGTVIDYLTWRQTHRLDHRAPTVSNRTLEKDRTVLHCVFELAEIRGWRAGNPVHNVPTPKSDPRRACILADDQYERLLTACSKNPMLFAYAAVLGETGLRCESEALHLRWEDIDFKGPFITVVSGRDGHRTKSGKTRQVPMTQRLVGVLKQHFRTFHFAEYSRGRSQYLFHHPNTRRHHQAGARLATMRTSMANAVKRADLPTHFRQHDLRHRRVTVWLAEGQPVHLVRQAMGHADLRTTMAYYSQTPEPLLQLVAVRPRRGSDGSSGAAQRPQREKA